MMKYMEENNMDRIKDVEMEKAFKIIMQGCIERKPCIRCNNRNSCQELFLQMMRGNSK